MRTSAVLSLAILAATAATSLYRSATLDTAGQLTIVADTGQVIRPRKSRGQTGFDKPGISPDRRSVGWLALYANEVPGSAPLPMKLLIFRDGRVVREFQTEQVFWDWQFQEGGARVAYSTGPTHGGAVVCELREIETGRSIATWPVTKEQPPDWAASLRVN